MAEPPQDAVLTNGNVKDATEPPENVQNGTRTPTHERKGTEPDAQAMVIDSLRSQIQDLFSQVTQLNNKLVKSYDRVSDLEDNVHVARSTIRSSTLRIAQLELERTQHLSALNTGLLVEKSHVTAELTRLMEKATEEAAQRGQAESARRAIEKDLDDLSANLFSQANSMVAEARYARALSERKVEQAELSLKSAEEAVTTMQQQVQLLQQQKEESDKQADEMRVVMGKGKFVAREPQNGSAAPPLRLLSSHQPYQEFLLFVAHLRSIHPSSPNPPAMSTLLTLPFLARLLTEDSEPTVRLDLAPSLNWLSRRSVLSAIHNGQVVIEPVSLATLLNELSSSSSYANSTPMIPGINNTTTNVCCALCGALVFSPADSQLNSTLLSRPPSHPLSLSRSWSGANNSSSNPWTASNLFKNPLSYTTILPVNSTPLPKVPAPPQSQTIHIFRLSVTVSASSQVVPTPVYLPPPSVSTSQALPPPPSRTDHNRTSSQTRSQSTIYPLCTNGWCLARLRMTCSLWAFVRSSIVDKVWEEEVPVLPPIQTKPSSKEKEAGKDASSKPPIPPRRRGLWGMASALGERAASWGEGDKEKDQAQDKKKANGKVLPPPPTHPAVQKATTPPPPLPKRSDGRRVPPPVSDVDDNSSAKPSSPPLSQVNGSDANDTGTVGEASDQTTPELTVSTEQTTASASEPEQESFLTPTEEIPVFIDKLSTPERPVKASADPSSPTIVPLPESPPTTPTPTLRPVSTVNGNARSASPAPPPLPRRAAARGPRPMSSQRISQSGAPDTDSVAKDAAATDKPTEITTSNSKSTAQEEVNRTSDSLQHPIEPEPASTLKVISQDKGTIPVVVNANINVEAEKDSTLASNQAPDLSSSSADTSSVVPEDDTKTASANAETQTLNREHDQDSKINGSDGEVCVGDATWEERTWKEVVKLKEDMFWARVGRLR